MSRTRKNLKLILLGFSAGLYLVAHVVFLLILFRLTRSAEGAMQYLYAIALVAATYVTYRDLFVRLQVFMVSTVIETVVVLNINNMVDSERAIKRATGMYAPKPMRYGAIDVSKEWRKKLYRQWFWKSPKHFQHHGSCFSWSLNFVRMVKSARPVGEKLPNLFDLTPVEFQLSPTATSEDIMSMGWPVFRTITEHGLNHNTGIHDWRISIDRHGIGLRIKKTEKDDAQT